MGLARSVLGSCACIRGSACDVGYSDGRAHCHAFSAKRATFASLQLLQVHDLGERAIRPAMLSLRLLHECRVLLASALPTENDKAGHLRLFISHAKMDGLPLAQALKH